MQAKQECDGSIWIFKQQNLEKELDQDLQMWEHPHSEKITE